MTEKELGETLSKITKATTSNKKQKRQQQSLKAIERETLLLLDEAERYCNANRLNYIGFLERYNKASNSF
jgi:uncharacterized protein YacL (UPF0231 family)